jgi:thiopurine S-methyltransferase
MIELNKDFWTARYRENATGWDVGEITQPLKDYFDQLKNKDISILIPGAGNAHEAEYLFNNGFTNVVVMDISEEPLLNIQKRIPAFPKEHLVLGDFFEHANTYDLIVEQTFFCALNPSLRKAYAKKMHETLNPNGKLVGLLFNDVLNDDKPPFGGNKKEYVSYFDSYFTFKVFDTCYNSIKPREGRELFVIFEKK